MQLEHFWCHGQMVGGVVAAVNKSHISAHKGKTGSQIILCEEGMVIPWKYEIKIKCDSSNCLTIKILSSHL